MKRIHIHIAVKQLDENIRFYSTLFGVPPTVIRDDYAKWKIDEPAVNFAISSRNQKPGINHLGIQVDSELQEIDQRLQAAQISAVKQDNAACCYAQSNKYWALDPQGVAWESFHTLDEIPVFGNDINTAANEDQTACCIPLRREDRNSESDCCVPGSTAASGCCQP